MRDDTVKSKLFTRRALVLGAIKLLLFCGIFIRYYYLQIFHSGQYTALSDKNRIRLIITPSIRGVIKDRNNSDIATNQIIYRVSCYTRNIKEIKDLVIKINSILEQHIELSDEEIQKRLKKTARSAPILIANNLTWSDVAKLELQGIESPNIVIEQGYKRFYNLRDLVAHITGYVSNPSKKELEELPETNYHELLIGKNGVEKAFDLRLRGVRGVRKVEVDVLGNYIRELSQDPPKEGEAIKISIDANIQQYIANLLEEREGNVTLIDITTGEIIALYSNPSYDPNIFIGGISAKDWDRISHDPKVPLINKNITSLYPPGSAFKIVTALAILEAGISPDFKVFCTGKHQVGNRIFHCNRSYGHGNVDLKLALAQSCNVYFYVLSEKIGMKNIVWAAKNLGFASKTNIELPFESKGHIPDPRWKFLRFHQRWSVGDTVNTSIGQGFVLATPFQLAVMMAKIASGKHTIPTILYQNNPMIFNDLNFSPHHLDLIRQGLFMVFNDPRGNGYQRRLNHPTFHISGKTGTAQVISSRTATQHQFVDHGLFVGFAPYHSPKYAISVIVEHGSWGKISALPLAKKILLHVSGIV